MNARINPSVGAVRERGMVLVISLLMLLVLTVIGLAATRSTTLEQRMTAGQNDQEVAFEAAEAALRDGEGSLSAANAPNYAANTAGAYTQDTMTVNWKTINWNDPSAVVTYGGGIQPVPASPPGYFVVQTNEISSTPGASLSADQPLSSSSVYLVYARGVGITGSTAVILQSSYRVGN